jgi:hypothetical protein
VRLWIGTTKTNPLPDRVRVVRDPAAADVTGHFSAALPVGRWCHGVGVALAGQSPPGAIPAWRLT